MQHLILGGACSGKSHYAEQLAKASNKQVIYIATGEAGDNEMLERIAKHQAERPKYWKTIEEPIFIADVIKRYANSKHFLLVDCLTLWLNNILFNAQGQYQEVIFLQQKQALLEITPHLNADIALVSGEVGMGVVPMDKMTRHFVDEVGKLHQQLTKICPQVTLVTAGLPLTLKH